MPDAELPVEVPPQCLLSLRGVMRGGRIEFQHDLGLADGAEVIVYMQPREADRLGYLPKGEGLRRAFGAWADDAEELDAFMEGTRQQRGVERREIEP